MGISENIKLLREQYGLSQKELGQIAGVSDKAVSTWEQGIKEPRMGAIQKIADHFGIQKSNIIEDNGLQSQSVPLTPAMNAKLPSEPRIELSPPECELIKKYRRLDDDGKDRINRQVDFELYQLEKSAQKGEVNCG